MRLRFLVVPMMVLVFCVGTGYAQTFTGMIDGYWSYNANKPNRVHQTNSLRAFDIRDQSFALNYGELAIDYKPGNVGVRVDLGFGDAIDLFNATNPATTAGGGTSTWRHVQQAYITGTKDKFTLDFGKFVTPIGAEVIETKDNWNYTRGFLF